MRWKPFSDQLSDSDYEEEQDFPDGDKSFYTDDTEEERRFFPPPNTIRFRHMASGQHLTVTVTKKRRGEREAKLTLAKRIKRLDNPK